MEKSDSIQEKSDEMQENPEPAEQESPEPVRQENPENAAEASGSKAQKQMPLWLMIPLDVVLLAACLLTFAYFHHVRPMKLESELPSKMTAVIPSENPYTRPTPAEDSTSAASEAEETSASSYETTGEEEQTAEESTGGASKSEETEKTAEPGQPAQTAAPGQPGKPSSPNEPSNPSHPSQPNAGGTTPSAPSAETPIVTTASPAPAPATPDLSGWGAKFPDKFRYGYDVVQTENSYQSHDIFVNIQKISYCDSVAYVADLYIRYLDNFKSAFAKDTYGKSIYENAIPLCTRNNAIIAVNGDYYATRDSGVIVRNYQAYRDVPKGDVGALYYDGTFRSFSKTEFQLEEEMQRGLYQTMSFSPALVKEGQVLSGFTGSVAEQHAPRTGFGYYEPGHYALVVVDGRQPGYSEGITFDQFAALFGQLGCTEAFNLDGGQTSQMLFMGQIYNKPYKYNGQASSLRDLPDIFFAAEVTS